jgi:hypothetical protein
VERKVWEREGVFGFGNLDRMSFVGTSRKRARMVRKKKEQRRERKRMVWTVESESLRMELTSIMERILLVGSNPVFILFIYFQKWNSFILLREILWIFLLFFSLNLICVFIFIII